MPILPNHLLWQRELKHSCDDLLGGSPLAAIVDEHNDWFSFDWTRQPLTGLAEFWDQVSNVEREFKEPGHPEADVVVRAEWDDPRKNPLHPSPKAGRRKVYVIVAGERISRPVGNLVVALNHDENLHRKLLTALTAETAGISTSGGSDHGEDDQT